MDKTASRLRVLHLEVTTAALRKNHQPAPESIQDEHWWVLLSEISCNLVDHVLRLHSDAIHEITLKLAERTRNQSFCTEPNN
jgi:hypothetical protein